MCVKEILILLVAVGLASATLSNIGKCKSGVTGLSNFDFDAFSKANGGKWYYKMVPSDETATKKWLESTPEANGKYRAKVYKQVGNAPAYVDSDQIREYKGNGVVTGTPVKSTGIYTFKWIYIYNDGSVVAFTICTSEGGKSSDAVFVLSNSDIPAAKQAKIKEIIKNKGLTVTLKNI